MDTLILVESNFENDELIWLFMNGKKDQPNIFTHLIQQWSATFNMTNAKIYELATRVHHLLIESQVLQELIQGWN